MPDSTFTIECTMSERWVPYFLGMLAEMESLGNVGSSRTVAFFADGDGDYRPRFTWTTETEPAPGSPSTWDAG